MLLLKTPMMLRGFKNKNVVPRQIIRNLYSIDGVFDKYLESSMMLQIEQHWRSKIKHNMKKYDVNKPKYYVLSMFPYPSGKLHMGHVRVYTLSDTFAHYYRMNGYNVIHPMGWDAFGLPAENAAIENKVNPREWTEKNIMSMKAQLMELGCTFDWEREIATCDPSYYKYTQLLFVEMYKAGLVFQKESIVNWDPVDQTVLADEQVDHNGCSWRSGAKVEKRPLNQWFFKTTKFAKSLLEGLNDPSLVNWRDIKKAQSNWIGDCDGTRIQFKVESSEGEICDTVTVWTRSPEYICGTEFIVLHPDHILNNQYPDTNLYAVNPFTGDRIPILISEDLDFDYGSESILGIPSVCSKQKHFAQNNNISCNKVILEEKNGSEYLVNSAQFSGMKVSEGREAVMSAASRMDIGGYPVSSNLQDWLISRQRYWGTPIPVIHCETCGSVPVPEADLPVELPHMDGLTNKGVSPLLEAKDWLNTTCPKCGKPAKRETDTMDTFVDSSWYFLRYLDPQNKEEPFSAEAAKQMPVDLYIGGKEHAYLHMYFARFFTHFLHSIGKLPVKEPFSNLITQGMVKGKSYRVKGTKQYLSEDQVKEVDGKYFKQDNNTPIVIEWDKMSKSKKNGVDPSLLIQKYGCDTVRMMMLTNVSPQTERNWSEKEYVGMRNLQIKLWKMVSQVLELQDEELPGMRYEGEMEEYRAKLRQARNENLRLINFNYHVTRNTAVIMARLSVMASAAWVVPGQVKRDAPEFQDLLGSILICLAPIAPHFTSELWAGLASSRNKTFQDFAWDRGVLEQDWPKLDSTFNLPVKVKGNGQDLCVLNVAKWRFENLTLEDAFDMACHDSTVQNVVLPHNITDKEFKYLQDFEIQLNISFDKPKPEVITLTPEEEEQIREQKRLEKEAQKKAKQEKKALRAERQKKSPGAAEDKSCYSCTHQQTN